MKLSAIVYPFLLLLFYFNTSSFAQTRVSCPEAAQYYAKDSVNIVTFGASTVEGVKGLGFQTMLSDNFQNCYTGKVIDITNQGIGGQTTAQGLLRIDRAVYNRTGFIVIDMGRFLRKLHPKITLKDHICLCAMENTILCGAKAAGRGLIIQLPMLLAIHLLGLLKESVKF